MKRGKIILMMAVMAFGMGVFSVDAEAAPKTMADGTVFDAEFYAATYSDVVAVLGTDEAILYQHYVTNGKAEGRMPCAIAFDPVYYAERYPDVKAAFGDNAELLYQHYIMFGIAEGRQGAGTDNAVVVTPEAQEPVSTPQIGGNALVPVVIEAGDEEYIRRGDRAYFRGDLDYVVPHEPGSLFDPANGFVRADCSAEPLYCAMRDYMVAQILAAPSGKTKGTYPIVFTYHNLQEFQYDARIVDNLVVDLYKSGLCRSVYIFNNPAGETITIGYPSEKVYKYFIYK